MGSSEAGRGEGGRRVARRCMLPSALTLGSTVLVGYTLHAVVTAESRTLIVFAAVANGTGLVGVMWRGRDGRIEVSVKADDDDALFAWDSALFRVGH
jgi:hypothetical protein